jgi:hypothetical protein
MSTFFLYCLAESMDSFPYIPENLQFDTLSKAKKALSRLAKIAPKAYGNYRIFEVTISANLIKLEGE